MKEKEYRENIALLNTRINGLNTRILTPEELVEDNDKGIISILNTIKPARNKASLSEIDSNKENIICFKEIINKMLETYKSKNKDYGNSFHNIFKECGMTYAYGHLKEKLERIKSLKDNEAKVKGESMIDSLYDLANYAILTIMEIEHKEEFK